MLPRPLRLRRSADIRRVVTGGYRYTTPYFTVYSSHNPQRDHFRAAVVVGKRVHKSAVVRHQYQRWLRALLQQSAGDLPTSADIVIVGRPALTHVRDQQTLRPHWQKSLQGIKQHQ